MQVIKVLAVAACLAGASTTSSTTNVEINNQLAGTSHLRTAVSRELGFYLRRHRPKDQDVSSEENSIEDVTTTRSTNTDGFMLPRRKKHNQDNIDEDDVLITERGHTRAGPDDTTSTAKRKRRNEGSDEEDVDESKQPWPTMPNLAFMPGIMVPFNQPFHQPSKFQDPFSNIPSVTPAPDSSSSSMVNNKQKPKTEFANTATH
jgi:hypothetical protein